MILLYIIVMAWDQSGLLRGPGSPFGRQTRTSTTELKRGAAQQGGELHQHGAAGVGSTWHIAGTKESPRILSYFLEMFHILSFFPHSFAAKSIWITLVHIFEWDLCSRWCGWRMEFEGDLCWGFVSRSRGCNCWWDDMTWYYDDFFYPLVI